LASILAPLTNESWNKEDIWEKLIDLRKNKLAHKLIVLRHHIENFKQIENLSIKEYSEGIVGNTTMNKIYENYLLISNTESFLFQAKSTLDVFSQLVGHVFKFSITSYGNGGQKLINKLESTDYDKYRHNADTLIATFKKAKSWVDRLVDMRDDVTHFSDLPGLSCFMFKQIKPGDNTAIVYYPSLSDGERVSKYMDFIWYNITDLLNTSLPVLVDVVKSRR
jgi:hypothetical protein